MKRKISFKKETIVQSVLVLMFSQVTIKLLGLVYKMYLTNKDGFGDTGNAIYNSGYQIYALLLAISSIGIPNAIAKMISERLAKGDEKGVKRVFRISIVFFAFIGLLATFLLYFSANYIANVWLQIPEAELTLKALSPAIFFVSLTSVIRGYFNGYQNMAKTANSQTIEQLAKTILTVVVVEIVAHFTSSDVTYMAAGANFATTLSVIISFVYAYRFFLFKRKEITGTVKIEKNDLKDIDKKSIRQILKNIIQISFPISLSSLVSTINKNIDSITAIRGLKTFMTDEAAKYWFGIYTGKIDTLIGLPMSINIAFATVLVPSIAKYFAKSEKEKAIKVIKSSLLSTILIGLPCMFGMMIFSNEILGLLFPNASEGGALFALTTVTIIFMMMAQTINGVLQGIGKYRVPATALACGVVAKLILNIILIPIPSIGIYGVAIGSIVCHIISFSIGFIVLKRTLNINFEFTKFVIKPLAASFIMCIVAYGFYNILILFIPWQVALIVSILVAIESYLLTAATFRILSKEEIIMLPNGRKIYSTLVKLKIYNKESIKENEE